jgi:hypothetical protein
MSSLRDDSALSQIDAVLKICFHAAQEMHPALICSMHLAIPFSSGGHSDSDIFTKVPASPTGTSSIATRASIPLADQTNDTNRSGSVRSTLA